MLFIFCYVTILYNKPLLNGEFGFTLYVNSVLLGSELAEVEMKTAVTFSLDTPITKFLQNLFSTAARYLKSSRFLY
jgi:hypothetical protein